MKMHSNPRAGAPGSGKTVTHSKPASTFGPGRVAMISQPAPRFDFPRDHTCKVCPGANRTR